MGPTRTSTRPSDAASMTSDTDGFQPESLLERRVQSEGIHTQALLGLSLAVRAAA